MEYLLPVITALISGAASAFAAIIVAVVQSKSQHNAVLAEMDKRDALQAQRIEQLEKKMDKHNRLIERTYKVEKSVELIGKDVEAADRRIDALERSSLRSKQADC